MGFLATLAFLGFGWVTFDGAIMKREDPNHALTVAPGVDEWVLRRNRSGHYFSPGLINGQPVRFLLDTPMVADAFQPDRWDYLYYLKDGRSRKVQQRHFVIYFEEEKVAKIDRPDGAFQDPTLPTSPGA